MSETYVVRIKSSAGRDATGVLQVLANSPDEAAAAVQRAVEPHAIIEVDDEPVSSEGAVRAGLLDGNPSLG